MKAVPRCRIDRENTAQTVKKLRDDLFYWELPEDTTGQIKRILNYYLGPLFLVVENQEARIQYLENQLNRIQENKKEQE